MVATKAPAARHELPGLGEAVCSVHAWLPKRPVDRFAFLAQLALGLAQGLTSQVNRLVVLAARVGAPRAATARGASSASSAWHTVTARNSKEDPEAKAKRSTACHDDLMAD
jgi:hypothetical protein